MNLRWYQQEAHDAVYEYFRAGKTGNPLVVAPTGSGKTLKIKALCESVCKNRPSVRVLVLAHQKELLEQNFQKLKQSWPQAPAGINAASLKQRDFDSQIIFASIHSVANHAESLGFFNLVIIDEAHMLPDNGEGRYNKLLSGLRQINPSLKVVGMTATPYRMKSGHLIGEDTLFTDIAYQVDMKRLIDEGYLCRVVPKRTKTQIDTSAVKKRGGEFASGDLEKVADSYTDAAIAEIIKFGVDRKSWLIFCCGVDHAQNVCESLRFLGIDAYSLTGDTPIIERERIIDDFRSGAIRCLVNVNVLTTGFDAPNVDLIALLRPTLSTGLYVQMIGRGMRVHADKTECLVLDFAGNTERHGPIDCVSKGRITKNDDLAVAPTKECPNCSSILHASIMLCPDCGHVFEQKKKVFETASTAELLSFDAPIEPINVTSIRLYRHKKPDKPDSIKMEFYDGPFFPAHTAWLCIDHGGYAATKGLQLFAKWTGDSLSTVEEILDFYGNREVKVSGTLHLKKSGKYFDIVKSEVSQTALLDSM